MRAARRLALALGLVAASSGAVAAAAPAPDTGAPRGVARASRTIVAAAFDGERRHDALAITIRDGVIARAESLPSADASAMAGNPAVERFPAPCVLTPGFLDLDARFGLAAGDEEAAEAIATDLLLADGFAPDAGEAAAFRRSGVTTAWLLGGAAAVAGGAGALVEPSASEPNVRRRAWGLGGSLALAARQPERAPSSLPDQARALRDVSGAVPGPLRVRFDDGASARLAASLGLPVGLPSDEGQALELDAASGLVASGDPAALLPHRLRLLLGRLRAGRLALGSGTSPLGPGAVRVLASRLVEEGADPDAVLSALTWHAASLAGLSDTGRLAPGARADVVLWSGDPLSLASRPLRIWVAGVETWRADDDAAPGARAQRLAPGGDAALAQRAAPGPWAGAAGRATPSTRGASVGAPRQPRSAGAAP